LIDIRLFRNGMTYCISEQESYNGKLCRVSAFVRIFNNLVVIYGMFI